MPTRYRNAIVLSFLFALLGGCANVHYEHDATSLGDSALVFGRVVLVRDGETGHLNAMGTQISLQRQGVGEEPKIVTESYDDEGRFYWKLQPGEYLLNISLNVSRGESADLAFDVPAAGRAYYMGDLIISGKKTYSALNAPNIREAKLHFEDKFEEEKRELARRSPRLQADVERLAVADVGDIKGRLEYFSNELGKAPLCCSSMSQFEVTPLAVDVPSSVDIEPRHGVFAFASGRSAFAAFALPQGDMPYLVTIRSEVSDGGVPYRYRILAPAVMLLDGQYRPVATVESGLFRATPASILPVRRVALEGEMLIKPAEPRARYLVIYTTPRQLSGGFLSHVPGVIALPAGLIGVSGMNMVTLEPWVSGSVRVTVHKQ